MKKRYSIIIRCFNEQKYIGWLLNRIKEQTLADQAEIVVVDSGSTDDTLNIVSQFEATIVQIKPEEFTFGYSLNRGIQAASGEICLIISAHCIPVEKNWLEEMTKPFQNEDVAMVYGRQVGWKTSKYSELQIFEKWFPEKDQEICQLAFANNANSAIRKSNWVKYKFNEELSGLEDLDWARTIRKDGFHISYTAKANVYHIHEETYPQVYNRYYREALAYKEIYKNEHFSWFDFARFTISNIFHDFGKSFSEGVFFDKFISIIRFRVNQFWGTYKGNNYRKPMSPAMKKHIFYPPKESSNESLQNETFETISNSAKFKIDEINYIDITRTLHPGIATWPGVKKFELINHKNIDSDGVEDSNLSFNIHTGTHIDAPSHFVKDGKSVDELSLKALMGETLVIDCTKMDGKIQVTREFLSEKVSGYMGQNFSLKRLLLKTENSMTAPSQNEEETFNEDFVAISSDCAKWLSEEGVELIGIDGPSIQSFADKNNLTHEYLLKSQTIIIEGLNLAEASEGFYNLFAFPLKIKGAEGAPARAILMKGLIT